MSFGINGPTPKFGIQEAQNMRNNGGGGNLGYFRRGNKKKDKKDEIDVFQVSDDIDEFLPEVLIEEENENVVKKVADLIKKFKKPKHS